MPGLFPRRRALVSAAFVAALGALVACASGPPPEPPIGARGPNNIDVDLPQLDLHADNIDVMATCPPAGGVSQGWIPSIPPWTPPATPANGPNASGASDAGASNDAAVAYVSDEPELNAGKRADEPANAPSPTEKAIRETLKPFRTCFERGRVRTQDRRERGHVAVAVRVGADGRVVKTETYGACELYRDVVSCIAHVATRLRFEPPVGGSTTIILPAVFAPRGGIVHPTPQPHDDYIAAAAIAVERARPELHACDERERRAVRPREAYATFIIEIDEKGKPGRQTIDAYDGNKELLQCAADVFSHTQFPVPSTGMATVRIPVRFNPTTFRPQLGK